MYLSVYLFDSFLSEIFQWQNDMHKNRPKQVNEKIPEMFIFPFMEVFSIDGNMNL